MRASSTVVVVGVVVQEYDQLEKMRLMGISRESAYAPCMSEPTRAVHHAVQVGDLRSH